MARSKPPSPRPTNDHELIASAVRTLEAEAGGIGALIAAIGNGLGQPFTAAVDLIRSARGRVIVTGMGKSGHVGRKIAATFASTGTPAYFVHPGEASHGDLGMITRDDVIMALSWSGETAELKDLIDYSRRFRIGLIAVTADAESTLAQAADVVLLLPQAREACPHNLAPTTSTLMQLALGDALAVALLESRGFTALDFRVLHPGGRLGAMLKFVRDIMHTGDAMPLAPLGTRNGGGDRRDDARRASAASASPTRGDGSPASSPTATCAGTCGPTCSRRSVDDVMTREPKTVRPDQLASEALEILNSSQDHRAVRGRARQAGRHRAFARSAARGRGVALISVAASPPPRSVETCQGEARQAGSTTSFAASARTTLTRLPAGAVRAADPPDRVVDADRAVAVDDRLRPA